MIQAFQIENSIGDSLYLDIRKPEDTGFLVTSVTGLNYTKNSIATQTYANYDGSNFGGQHIEHRNIVMTIVFYENNLNHDDVETLRWKLLRYFLPKSQLKFTAINEHGAFWIKGYVETCEINIFTSRETAQISILCDDPFFTSAESSKVVNLGFVESNFEFEFSSEMTEPAPPYEKTIYGRKSVSTNVSDYYNIEFTDIPVIKHRVGKQLTFLYGTEKLDYKLTPNEAGGNTFEMCLPDDYADSYEVTANHVGFTTEPNEAGGYTVKCDSTNAGIEFGLIKLYPSTIIDYRGSATTGVQIFIEIKGHISNLKINNKTRGEVIRIDDEMVMRIIRSAIKKYDQIVIDTRQGQKSVKLIRDGLSYDIINACLPVNNWIHIQPGINEFTYSSHAEIENIDISVIYSERFLGI